MKSHRWKTQVYLGVTLGAVGLVLGIFYGIMGMVIAETPGGLKRGEGRLLIAIACGLAYGTVVLANYALKRGWGHRFGSFLDDPDQETLPPPPGVETRCRRCGLSFPVYPNDAHNAGFCSWACWDAHLKSQATRKGRVG